MAQSATAPSWNAEHTDAKGYWVTAPKQAVEHLEFDWPAVDDDPSDTPPAPVEVATPALNTPAPASRAQRKAQRQQMTPAPAAVRVRPEPLLPVAPIAAAALPSAFAEGFEVPEFTLSEKKKAVESQSARDAALARWEILETQIPSDAFEDVPTEEVARPPASNVKVFVRSSAFTEAITQDIPANARPLSPAPVKVAKATESAQSSPQGPGTNRAPATTPPAPQRVAPVVPVVSSVAPEPAPADLSMDQKRELAKQMADKAMAAARSNASNRSPGSLPPVHSLMSAQPQAPVRLSERAKESWSWDEADPLAVAQPMVSRPSLSLVQSPQTSHDDYEHILATPMAAPPRPNCIVPWPLPQARAVVGGPGLDANVEPLVLIEGLDSISLNEPLPAMPAQPTQADDAASSVGMWVAVGGIVVVCTFATVASMGLCTLAAVAVVLS